MAIFTSIGAAIFGAGTFLAGVTAAGLQVAAGLVLSSLGRGANDAEPQPPKFGVQGKLTAGEDVPRSIALGESCTAGSLVWHNTFGAGGVMSARVIALYDLPIRELRYPIVAGVDCTLLKDQPHPNYGWPVADYRVGGVDHLWIKFYDGGQVAADPFLVSTFAADPDRPYQASRIGRGMAYVVVFARAPERNDEGDKPLFQGIPELKFVTHGTRWYNPALDSTVGGTGAHRWNDFSTWGGVGDFNPFVHLYNLKRGIADRVSGQWLYGMQGTSAARLPVENWIAAIGDAQADIAGPGGAEPTYRAGGEIQVGAQVAQTEEALLTAANARLVENGGTYTVFAGPPGAPVMAFTDGDILSTEEQSFSPFQSLSDTVNGIVASYPNPAEGWNDKKFTSLRPDLEPAAGNRRLVIPISLDLVPYAGQVQRLVKWAIDEAQRARRHTFVLGPEFRRIEPGDVVLWTSARNGYVDKLFRVDGVVYKFNLDVIVDLTEVDPSDYDWDQATDYRPPIDGPLSLVGPKPMPMQGWQVFPGIIVDADGASRRPTIEVRAAGSVPGVERVRVQVRAGGEDGPLIFDGDSQPYADPWRWLLQGQFPPNVLCYVRGIFVGPPAANWSDWLAVTTPNIRLGASDIALDLSNVAQDVLAQLGLKPRQLIEQFKQFGTLLEEVDRENYTKREALFREIGVELEGLSASFTEIIEVALGPGGAIAQALESLYAAMGGNTAEVNIRWTAQAAPSGYSARYAVQAAVNDGTFRSATLFLDVPTDPTQPTRIGLMAGQTAFFTSAGVPIGLISEDGFFRSANDAITINMLTGDLVSAGNFSFG
ncbi:MAG: phage tail protein [Candidatus Devosia phytovorans]|uniref:Phage tail protein n=1 Tax=Candidatus Devosia phytovorans TaxID=3121372 RepID=A0AAJ6B2S8_9HYPH|nr:phage tail protein [Devosia sp.]WEK05783.1 MAG: phage tail protein [Devosia sp.]